MRRILICSCLLLAACGGQSTVVGPVPPNLLNSPTTITVSGAPVVMSFALVTTTTRSGVGLLGIVQTNDNLQIGGASVGRVWIVRGDVAWVANATRVPDPLPTNVVEKFTTAGGPAWPLGDSVDIVVEVRDANGGVQLLRGPHVTITSSDPV
jgi:hypothetical protein